MEFVWVVKRYDLFDLSFPHGFVGGEENPDVTRYVERIRQKGFFVERRHAEQDSSLKQVIPYCIVTNPDGVMLLRRRSTQAEARLHDKMSIGVGGHINPEDADRDVLDTGLEREIDEELHIPPGWRSHAVGIINDESTDVGSVHFGLVYRIESDSTDVSIREDDKMEGKFVSRDELLAIHSEQAAKFESWSAMILDQADLALGPVPAPAG